jgi:hypothetical protein
METKSRKLISFFSENIFSARVLAFIIITLTAIISRFYISFSNDLFNGVDGGYYPLQVRSILVPISHLSNHLHKEKIFIAL